MAIDLVARLTIQDDFTRRFNRITRSMGDMGGAVNRQAKQLTGLRTQILGIAAGYASAVGAVKLFNATIGEAAKHEMAQVTVEALFNDKALSNDYLKMVEKVAIDSPLLNSADMLSSGKGFVAMTKDIDELTGAWKIAEKLMVLDPTQGTDGAAFALKEMWQGDSMSMVERFGLDKKSMNRIKKLPIADQIREIDGLLSGMGISQKTIEKMGNTTLGQWSAVNERVKKFRTLIGGMGNSKIGEVLSEIVAKFDAMDTGAIAAKIDKVIGGAIESIINFSKKAWEMRDPILAAIKVIGTFVGVVVGIVAVASVISGIGAAFAFLVSPIGLAAVAIIGIGSALKAAYENSEPFRKVVDGIVGAIKGLFVALSGGGDAKSMDIMQKAGLDTAQIAGVLAFGDTLKTAFDRVKTVFAGVGTLMSGGGTGDLLSALGFSPEMISKITEFVTSIKTKVGEFVTFLAAKWASMQPMISTLIETFIRLKDSAISIFMTLWGTLQPIFGALGVAFSIIADIAILAFNSIIAPAIRFIITMFQALWVIVGPILELLGAAIGTAFAVLKVVWDTILKPVAKWLLSTFVTVFEAMQDQLAIATENFGWLGDKISGVVDWFKRITDSVKNFKVPDWLAKLGGGGTVKFEETTTEAKSKGKSNYHGIDYVPKNNYSADLHRGEAVLTAAENKERKQGGSGSGVMISGNTFNVRQESDIDAVAEALLIKLKRAEGAGGY